MIKAPYRYSFGDIKQAQFLLIAKRSLLRQAKTVQAVTYFRTIPCYLCPFPPISIPPPFQPLICLGRSRHSPARTIHPYTVLFLRVPMITLLRLVLVFIQALLVRTWYELLRRLYAGLDLQVNWHGSVYLYVVITSTALDNGFQSRSAASSSFGCILISAPVARFLPNLTRSSVYQPDKTARTSPECVRHLKWPAQRLLR